MGRVKVYLTAGLVEGRVGLLLVTCDVVGSSMRGLLDNWATMVRVCLDSGGTMEEVARAMAWHEYEPKGKTDNVDLPFARSVVDFAVRWALRQEEGCRDEGMKAVGRVG
jgi:ribonucleoside-diphosphate reductase alpha chain